MNILTSTSFNAENASFLYQSLLIGEEIEVLLSTSGGGNIPSGITTINGLLIAIKMGTVSSSFGIFDFKLNEYNTVNDAIAGNVNKIIGGVNSFTFPDAPPFDPPPRVFDLGIENIIAGKFYSLNIIAQSSSGFFTGTLGLNNNPYVLLKDTFTGQDPWPNIIPRFRLFEKIPGNDFFTQPQKLIWSSDDANGTLADVGWPLAAPIITGIQEDVNYSQNLSVKITGTDLDLNPILKINNQTIGIDNFTATEINFTMQESLVTIEQQLDFTITTDGGTSGVFSIQTNVPTATVTGMAPNGIAQGETKKIRFLGTGFVETNLFATVSDPVGSDIVVNSQTVTANYIELDITAVSTATAGIRKAVFRQHGSLGLVVFTASFMVSNPNTEDLLRNSTGTVAPFLMRECECNGNKNCKICKGNGFFWDFVIDSNGDFSYVDGNEKLAMEVLGDFEIRQTSNFFNPSIGSNFFSLLNSKFDLGELRNEANSEAKGMIDRMIFSQKEEERRKELDNTEKVAGLTSVEVETLDGETGKTGIGVNITVNDFNGDTLKVVPKPRRSL